MLKLINKMKGQSTLEYAVLIIIIIGALLTIQVYIKRGVQGRLKSASDDIGDQYSSGNTKLVKSTVTKSSTTELFGGGIQADKADRIKNQGISTSTMVKDSPESTKTAERSQIINVDQEFWGKN